MPYSKVPDHDEAADEQIAALHAAEDESKAQDEEGEHRDSETVVHYGGEVKALGDGRMGGYLVRFSSPEDPDLENDFFTSETDFGSAEKSDVYYHHGLDATLGRRRLGIATLKTDEVGVWMETQIELRDEYEQAIYQLAEKGKLGLSSGTAHHLVEREKKDGAFHIKKWPLGLDASLTPTPAEPRNSARPLKSLQPTKLIVNLPDSNSESSNTKSSEADGPQASDDATATATGTDGESPINITVHVQSPSKSMPDETKTQEETDEAPQEEVTQDPLEEYKLGLITKNQYLKATGREPIGDEGDTYYTTTSAREDQKAQGGRTVRGQYETSSTGAPNFNEQTGTGDTEAKALAHWIKTGDIGGMEHLQSHESGVTLINPTKANVKASNDTSMNIGTGADGGNTVPTGHFEGIVARRDPAMLTNRLGVQRIPGQGTTVNVPVDNEDDGEFVETAEQTDAHGNNFDRDAPAIGQVAMSLVKYSKKVELTDELLEDEESRLLSFLENFIGRGMAKTHNNLLLTEVGTNGTSFKTFGSNSAIAAGEIEAIVGNDDLGAYLEDDGGSVAWVGRNSTLWDVKSITGNDRLYAQQVMGGDGPDLLGHRFLLSNKADSISASGKSLYFGNWFYVGWREAPAFQVIRDIYSVDGMTVLKYYFRTTYDVLQAEAIGYGEHPT